MISENHLREQRALGARDQVARASSRHPARKRPSRHGHARPRSRVRYGARADTITIFPNTVDVIGYRHAADRLRERRTEIRQGLSIADGALVVMQVGRLISQKGVEETLEAVARARALTPRPLHLLLVGNGELRPSLERRADELGLTATFTGFRQGEALLECYAAADIFALFSRREPWGSSSTKRLLSAFRSS